MTAGNRDKENTNQTVDDTLINKTTNLNREPSRTDLLKTSKYVVKHFRFPNLAYAPTTREKPEAVSRLMAEEPYYIDENPDCYRIEHRYSHVTGKRTSCELIKSHEVNRFKLPPIQLNTVENSNLTDNNYLPGEYTKCCDVTPNSFSRCFRNASDSWNRSAIHRDRTAFKGRSSTAIKARGSSSVSLSTCRGEQVTFKNRLTNSAQLIDDLNHTSGKMSALKIDNRHDMAANDHVKQHMKRQEQWMRTERLKNWRKQPSNRFSKKHVYQHSASSSGQKSDVVSGNSNETINSSSSDYQQPLVEEMDDERRESIEKCLKWMEHLPRKFSGMHMFTPTPIDQS